MSSVHDRLAECEQRNGGHLEDVMSGKMCFFFVLCFVSRPLTHLFLQILKYVLPHKCNCITISDTFNFLKLKNRPIRWRTLYMQQENMVLFLFGKFFFFVKYNGAFPFLSHVLYSVRFVLPLG